MAADIGSIRVDKEHRLVLWALPAEDARNLAHELDCDRSRKNGWGPDARALFEAADELERPIDNA